MIEAMVAPVLTPQRIELGALLRSVVKVQCVSDAPDYEQPWQSQGPTNTFGSGSIIETKRGLRLLTNAHCVANHVFVEVRRYGRARKYVAEVEALGQECDLALLRIDDEGFFHGTIPIPIGTLPALRDRVSVCGYPIGGERLSITEGIVSRIELVSYAQTNRSLLAIQIDAAINPGNSGGPVLLDGELVGVAFQALDGAEQIGYMIAPPVVQHFLDDLDNGRYEGFPAIGVRTQPLEGEAHRRYLDLPSDVDGGVLITRVAFGSSGWGVIEPGDVLIDVDGEPLASDGTVSVRDGEQLHYDAVVGRHHVGDRMRVTVWRRGQALPCVLELKPPPTLVADERYDARPSYFIFGGLLCAPLTRDYLKTWGDQWWQVAPRELVALSEDGVPTPERQEPVVIQKVLPDRVNQGYHDLESLLVTQVDEVRVRSLAHFIELVEHGTSQFLRIDTSDGRTVVLDRARARDHGPAILRRFSVPSDRSADLAG